MGKLNLWSQQEDQIIREQFQNFRSRKWKNISKILSKKGYERGEAECRQRYVNHLNPALDRNNDISEDQLQILYGKYEQYGPKWCLIQTFIPNRTQIKIKNVFYGNIRLFLKKLYKYFTKKTAVFINELKTDDLQTIYDGTQQFSGFSLMKKAFRKFHYKINQQNCNSIISASQSEYFSLLNKILEYKTKIKPLERKSVCSENQQQEILNSQNIKLRILNKQLEKISSSDAKIQKRNNLQQNQKYQSFSKVQSQNKFQHQSPPITNLQCLPGFYGVPFGTNCLINMNLNVSGLQKGNFNEQFYQEYRNWQNVGIQLWPIYISSAQNSKGLEIDSKSKNEDNMHCQQLQFKTIGNQQ